MRQDKGGGSRILSLWMFLIWIIIGVAIVSGVLIFYGNSADVRKFEARSLISRIGGCLVEQGELVEGFDEKFDIFSECKLSKEVLAESGLYYLKIEILDEKGVLKFKPIEAGNNEFFGKYKLKESSEAPQWAECDETSFYALSGEERLLIKVFAGSNQKGKKL